MTTVSRLMRHRMEALGVSPLVLANGLPPEAYRMPEPGVQRGRHCHINRPFCALDDFWIKLGYLFGELQCLGHKLVFAIDMVNQSNTQRRIGIDPPAGQDQFLGNPGADNSRQSLGASQIGNHAELDFRQAVASGETLEP